MVSLTLPQVLHALMLTTGALVAATTSGRIKETDKVTFTGDFASLGEVTIQEVLDAADEAIGAARAEVGQ